MTFLLCDPGWYVHNLTSIQNKWDDNTHTRTHTEVFVTSIIEREDQCEWNRMTRMTGPDCVVMCNLINTHTHTHTAVVVDRFY